MVRTEPRKITVLGHVVVVDELGKHMAVEHDGTITWDKLQKIKNKVWGPEARAIEVYPAAPMVINNANVRHLWKLGRGEFCPDLLGRPSGYDQSLEAAQALAWAEAD